MTIAAPLGSSPSPMPSMVGPLSLARPPRSQFSSAGQKLSSAVTPRPSSEDHLDDDNSGICAWIPSYDSKKLQSYVKEKSFLISERGALADGISPAFLSS
ncbi:hypothetical protein C4D60_Mb11t04240 [Musa balbisiana]|uniref:Uncharacterized protein n=1 Tax=Musa balbisiana TaxID=52838 RepID=A0A4V4H5A1_MUSBA|nr:hypothetical protein C4D60_Mb11t04240 [Musa balbisiana]